MTNNDLRFSVDFYLSTKVMKFTDLIGTPSGSGYDTLLSAAPNGETNVNIKGITRLNGPAGVFYANTGFGSSDFTSPDISSSGWNKSSVSLPVAGSDVMCGNYNFEYLVQLELLGTFGGYNAKFKVAGDYTTLLGTSPTGLKFSVFGGSHTGQYTITSLSYDAGAGETWFVVSSPPSTFTPDLGEGCGILFTTSKPYAYCYTQPVPTVDVSSSCVFSQLTSEDTTSYDVKFNGVNITPAVSRAWNINCPSTYSSTPVTGTSNPFIIGYGTPTLAGANIWTGDYVSTLQSIFTYSVESWGIYTWFIVHDEIVSTTPHTVKCDTCFCNLFDCVKNLFTKYQTQLNDNPSAARLTEAKIIQVLDNWMMFQMAERCGESTQEFCAAITAIIVGENCQCAPSSTTESVEVVPLALQVVPGGGGSQITLSDGNTPLPATPSTGDTHIFTSTGTVASEGDVYWYNGSWTFQLNIMGATGATGATGAPGAAGTNGVAVVFDNTLETPTQITASSFLTFTGMTTGAITNLTNDGDKLVVNASFGCESPVYNGQVKLTIDGSDISIPIYGGTGTYHEFNGNTWHFYLTLEITLVDKANDKISIRYSVRPTDYYLLSPAVGETVVNVTLSDYTSLTINAEGKGDGTHYVSCQQLSVTYYKI